MAGFPTRRACGLPQAAVHPLASVGWSERVQAGFAAVADELVPARVVGVERGWCRLATPTGERSLPEPGTAVGDWVALDGDTVREVLPRWSALGRQDPGGGRQVLAANVDLVLIATPADRLSSTRVERELVLAWDSGARPVVVLTKLDVAPSDVVDELAVRLATVDVIATSAVTGDGLDAIRDLLVYPVTGVFLGPSGAGKSTLINALLGEDRLAVGAVRDDDRRGRHTTTSRQLVALPSGGSLIDMPGLRSLGLDAGEDAVAAAFPDIDALARDCRFGDCSHAVEPGCAIAAAVGAGTLDPDRLASYRKLLRESAFEQRRVDPVVRAEETRVWKTRTKEQRRRYREREE
jgi:ribosome biogenesis GTPase / thiamine phosphate phosphatase